MAITIKKSPANRTEAKNAQHGDPVVENATFVINRGEDDGGMLLCGLHSDRTDRGQHVYTIRVEAADVIRMLLNLPTKFIPAAFAAAAKDLGDDGFWPCPKPDAVRVLEIIHALAGCVVTKPPA